LMLHSRQDSPAIAAVVRAARASWTASGWLTGRRRPAPAGSQLGAMFLTFCLFFPDRALELAKGVLTIATLAAFLFAVAAFLLAVVAATVQLIAALYIAVDGAYWMTYWFFPLVCYTDGQVVPCEF
jgi:hypothetical protein